MGGDLTAAEEGTTAEEREARMVGIASRVGGKKIAWGLVGHVDETCLLSPYLLAYLFPPALLSVSLEEEGEGKGEGEEGEGEAGASFAVMEPSLNMWDISVCRGFIDSFPLTMATFADYLKPRASGPRGVYHESLDPEAYVSDVMAGHVKAARGSLVACKLLRAIPLHS
ncbi:unnamed protein product [Closterium sp. NIES-64]|nr:unnamed protein product [Closterium sp. NIES-64]